MQAVANTSTRLESCSYTIAGVAQVLRACPHMTKVRLCGASGMTQDEVKALRREHPLVSLTRYADRDSCASLSLYGHHTERDEWVCTGDCKCKVATYKINV